MKLRDSILIFLAIFYFMVIVNAQVHENERDKINGSYDIRVVLDHIFISKKNSSFEISEIVVFRNEGPEIYYNKDNHTYFAISTPQGVKNLKTQVMECCLVEEDGMVYMDPMESIDPGGNFQMQITYTLDPHGNEYIFNKSAVYNTTSLSVFIEKKSGTELEGIYNTLTLSGSEYNVAAFSDIGAGETVSIPIKIIEESGYIYAVIGLFSLFSIGLIYHFRGKIHRRKEYTLPELELEKKKIFDAIYGFEKHAGTESSEEYRRLMDEYRQKAIRIFTKIDEIKNR